MLKSKILILSWIMILSVLYCQKNTSTHQRLFPADHPNIHYIGRIDFSDPKHPKLSGAGAYFRIHFKGRDF